VASGIALAAFSGAKAEGRLVVYCSATNEMCETETKAFGEKYNVKTSFIRNGSGSTLAKVDAEKKTRRRMSGTAARWIRSPRPGKWDCCSPINRQSGQIMEKFRDPAKVKGNLSSAVYVGILGFGVNTQRLKEKNCRCRNAGKI
jgi:iron(III) transport system substrate-binding protein